jgi:hypothetical protein
MPVSHDLLKRNLWGLPDCWANQPHKHHHLRRADQTPSFEVVVGPGRTCGQLEPSREADWLEPVAHYIAKRASVREAEVDFARVPGVAFAPETDPEFLPDWLLAI